MIQQIVRLPYLGILVVRLSWILETTFRVMQQVSDVTTGEGREELVCYVICLWCILSPQNRVQGSVCH